MKRRTLLTSYIIVFLVSSLTLFADVTIERSTPMKGGGHSLGTKLYKATKKEQAFLDKVNEKRTHFTSNIDLSALGISDNRKVKKNPNLIYDKEYQLKKQVGKYVG